MFFTTNLEYRKHFKTFLPQNIRKIHPGRAPVLWNGGLRSVELLIKKFCFLGVHIFNRTNFDLIGQEKDKFT